MPHNHLKTIRYQLIAVICLLILIRAAGGTTTAAQPGSAEPAQGQQTWSEPVILSDSNLPVDSEHADIAVCEDGTVYVVWEQDSWIWFAVREPSAGWSEAKPVQFEKAPALAWEPAIAVSSDCVLHLVWSTLWFGYNEIFYTTRENGVFLDPINVSDTSRQQGGSFQPDIVVDSGGGPHVVWVDTIYGRPQLYEGWPAEGLPRGYWGKRPIPGGEGDLVQVPVLAIDHLDQLHLAWVRQDKSSSDVIYKRPVDWLTNVVENISYSSNFSRLPDMAISSSKVVITWQETLDGDDEIFVTWRPLDAYSSFNAVPLNLSNSDANSRWPAVTVDRYGNVVVAWDEGKPIETIWARFWRGIGDWGAVREIPNTGTSVKEPAIAAFSETTRSRIYAVWSQKDGPGDTWDVYFSEMTLETYPFYLPLLMSKASGG